MTRGKKALTDRQAILVKRVREARAALDSVDIELADKIEELTRTLRGEAENEVRARIWAALDESVPIEDLKRAMLMTNHNSFKQRWTDSYVVTAPKDWYLEGNKIHLTKFEGYVVDMWFFLDPQGAVTMDYADLEKEEGPVMTPLLETELNAEWLALLATFKEELTNG